MYVQGVSPSSSNFAAAKSVPPKSANAPPNSTSNWKVGVNAPSHLAVRLSGCPLRKSPPRRPGPRRCRPDCPGRPARWQTLHPRSQRRLERSGSPWAHLPRPLATTRLTRPAAHHQRPTPRPDGRPSGRLPGRAVATLAVPPPTKCPSLRPPFGSARHRGPSHPLHL